MKDNETLQKMIELLKKYLNDTKNLKKSSKNNQISLQSLVFQKNRGIMYQ